ncbi:MAG: arylesterase [Acidobacteria bacterium]|nr:arylesterase [Acidobacteriota bacterium]MXZ72840.1 arylesterase [Acidobacteriota bacterium]MYD69953.1 arylesterase [Acidobacteriota bacterium]MYJ05346.1 arylesterase [Acidobacteriota bacterium]
MRFVPTALLVAGMTACGAAPPESVVPSAFRTAPDATETGRRSAPEPPVGPRPRVVILGDSLTAGLGLPEHEAFPARLQARVDAAGWPIEIAPRGVSGDTTAGGLRRLDWAIDGDVHMLVVALGGNDGLRGLPVEQMHDNLAAIVDRAGERDIAVVLAGMEAPPNFGAIYTSQFREVFRTLAETRDVVLIPFLLEGVAGEPDLNQRDGIHPNAAGAERVASHLWSTLEPLLAEIATGSAVRLEGAQ